MSFQKLIGGKYKIRILWVLRHGPLRYGEVKTLLPRGAEGSQEIAPRVLSRELEGAGADRPLSIEKTPRRGSSGRSSIA